MATSLTQKLADTRNNLPLITPTKEDNNMMLININNLITANMRVEHLHCANEKLAPVSIRTCVGHA